MRRPNFLAKNIQINHLMDHSDDDDDVDDYVAKELSAPILTGEDY